MFDRLFSITFPRIGLATVIDVLLVAFLLYQFLVIIRGRRALPILTGIFMLVGAYLLAVRTGLTLLRTVLEAMAPYTVFALIVMFQSDIRRVLARMGRHGWLSGGQNVERREFAQELLLTLASLAHSNTGALIVLERDIGLRTFIESGVRIDGVLSRDLLLSVFHVGTAMHDGAVIVQGDRIAAASCFLPLSMNPRIMSTLGTRHRAAIGVTEETDCLSLVVSEETGRISAASFGEIDTNLTLDQVEARILSHFGTRRKRPAEPKEQEKSTAAGQEEAVR